MAFIFNASVLRIVGVLLFGHALYVLHIGYVFVVLGLIIAFFVIVFHFLNASFAFIICEHEDDIQKR